MKIKRSVVVIFPNLITIGNGICGFAALVKLFKVDVAAAEGTPVLEGEQFIVFAAWLVLLGMVFDVFDGQVARLTGRTSDLGAELDSLCDLVTFGLVPAVMVVRMNMVYARAWQYWVWFLCLLYFVGALLRLARFNVENDHDESSHLCFKGLPSPAAAGCVATLVILFYYLKNFQARELQLLADYRDTIFSSIAWLPFGLPFVAAFLGYTMVHTKLKFDHLGSRLLMRRHSFDTLSYLIFGGILVSTLPEILLPLFFLGYLVYTPVRYVIRRRFGMRPVSDAAVRTGNGARRPAEPDASRQPGERTGEPGR